MLNVVACIAQLHDLRLVVLAGLVCVLTSLAAMNMLSRAGASTKRLRAFWLAAAGVVAGSGIWSTHFIAMLAFQPGIPVGYDMGLTLLSIVIAVGMSAVGYLVALRPGLAVLGGAIAGAAIGSMHFVGMLAVYAPATAVWDANYVIASWLIGIVLATLAVKRVLSSATRWHYAQATLLLTLAICGMHFTAMTAVTYYPDSSIAVPQTVFDPFALSLAIASVAVVVMILGLVGALVDSHLARRADEESRRLRAYILELEATRDELERTSADLSAALQDADAASKAKSEFLAAMSHELRTPLNAVIGFSDMMLGEIFGPVGSPRYREYITDIRTSGTHLLALINDVLDLTKLDSGVVALDEEFLEIPEIVSETLRLVAHQAERNNVKLCDEAGGKLPLLRADRRRVRQILLNLLINAVKFTPGGGKVVVSVEQRADGLAVVISDSGIGIAAEELPKVMERFYQVDSRLGRKFGGAGLGLPLARQLAELHGGRLELQSRLGAGTKVAVVFPRERVSEQGQASQAA